MRIRQIVLGVILFLLGLAIAGTALASGGGDFVFDWHTIDGGGGTSAVGDYALSGTRLASPTRAR